MSSSFHFAAPEDGALVLYAALERLGEYLSFEHESLSIVLVQAGRVQASRALDTLAQLHLEPDSGTNELRALLEQAHGAFEFVLEVLAGISCRQCTLSAWGLPGPESFDMHVRWSAARLQDIVTTLEHALAA